MVGKVLVIANKAFEVEPLVGVLANSVASPSRNRRDLRVLATSPSDGPRAKLTFKSGNFAEIWCIEDLMDKGKSSSSSEEKARVLPYVLVGSGQSDSVLAVLAFGTAASPGAASRNGCVSVGSSVFVYNHYETGPPNPDSDWKDSKNTGCVISSEAGESLVASLKADTSYFAEVERRLLAPAGPPPATVEVVTDARAVAVSSVNVTDRTLYKTIDAKALAAAADNGVQSVASLETTHGVIRLALESTVSFMFVSGIANRVGQFGQDNPFYKGNFVASHNAAIATCWALDALFD